jgi:hypothetical protein
MTPTTFILLSFAKAMLVKKWVVHRSPAELLTMDVPALEHCYQSLSPISGNHSAGDYLRLVQARRASQRRQIGAPLRHYKVSRILVRAEFLQLHDKSKSGKKLSMMVPFFISARFTG